MNQTTLQVSLQYSTSVTADGNGTFRIDTKLRSDNSTIDASEDYFYPDSQILFDKLLPETTYSYDISVFVMPPGGVSKVRIGYAHGEIRTDGPPGEDDKCDNDSDVLQNIIYATCRNM